MIVKTIEMFEEIVEDGEILARELGFNSFSAFVRFTLKEKIRKNAKTIEEAKKRRNQQEASSKKG